MDRASGLPNVMIVGSNLTWGDLFFTFLLPFSKIIFWKSCHFSSKSYSKHHKTSSNGWFISSSTKYYFMDQFDFSRTVCRVYSLITTQLHAFCILSLWKDESFIASFLTEFFGSFSVFSGIMRLFQYSTKNEETRIQWFHTKWHFAIF